MTETTVGAGDHPHMPLMTATPFAPFPAPMGPDAALDALYAAFEDVPRPTNAFCEQCFSPEARELIVRAEPLRTKPPEHFAGIFGEHIDCSVGAEGFFHFFPRMLETTFFTFPAWPDLTGLALSCGLLRLDAAPMRALRNVAAVAARGYFERRDSAPLATGREGGGWGRYDKGEGGVLLIRLLLALRTEPAAIFRTLFGRDDDLVWLTIAEALYEDVWLNEAYAEAVPPINDMIGRVAWIDLFEVVPPQRLEAGIGHFSDKGRRSREPRRVRAQYEAFRERAAMDDRGVLVRDLLVALGPLERG